MTNGPPGPGSNDICGPVQPDSNSNKCNIIFHVYNTQTMYYWHYCRLKIAVFNIIDYIMCY